MVGKGWGEIAAGGLDLEGLDTPQTDNLEIFTKLFFYVKVNSFSIFYGWAYSQRVRTRSHSLTSHTLNIGYMPIPDYKILESPPCVRGWVGGRQLLNSHGWVSSVRAGMGR